MDRSPADILDDLLLVGTGKPLGYLPLETLVEICKVDPQDIKSKLDKKGLKTLVLTNEESSVWSGALYAYDEQALTELLESRKEVLLQAGWPTEPELFVRNLRNLAEPGSDLFNVIADAYGDTNNIGRKQQ